MYPELWKVPLRERAGYLIHIIDAGLAGFGSCAGICIYLIYPLNQKPNRQESEFAKELNVPGGAIHLIYLTSPQLAKVVHIEPSVENGTTL